MTQNYFDFSSLNNLPDLDRFRCLKIAFDSDQFLKLQTEQIFSQMGLTQSRNNPFEWNSFKDIAKQAIIRANVPLRKEETVGQLFARALTTSDFSELLTNISTKLVETGWENLPVSYPEWTKSVEVPDFKEASLLSISSFSSFTKTGENGEIGQDGNFKIESSKSFKLETFGRIFPINRRAYINDDLEVLKSVPMLMGRISKTIFGRNNFQFAFE